MENNNFHSAHNDLMTTAITESNLMLDDSAELFFLNIYSITRFSKVTHSASLFLAEKRMYGETWH